MTSLKTRRMSLLARYLVLLIATVAVIFPVFWMITSALRPSSELFSVPPKFLPETFTVDAFTEAWSNTQLPKFLLNSIIVVLFSTVIGLVFSTLAAYGLSRYEFRGKGSFLTFLLMTQMFPSIMLLIPYFQIISELGLYNKLSALVITYASFTVPFCSWILYGYMRSIPRELDEAAYLDGCSPFQAFYKVVLPLAKPGIIATSIFSFITGWNEYIYSLTLIQSEGRRTLTVGIGILAGNDALDWNALMASSVIAVVPMVLIFVFFQRHLVGGLAAGAVKG